MSYVTEKINRYFNNNLYALVDCCVHEWNLQFM